MMRSPVTTRRSARTVASPVASDSARDAASALLGAVSTEGNVSGGKGIGRDSNTKPTKQETTGAGSGKDSRKVHKLDGKAYQPWGRRSRSSSEAGSDTACSKGGSGKEACNEQVLSTDMGVQCDDIAWCKGGPGKEVCNELVLLNDMGVQCDKCDHWFHAACQSISEDAYEALKTHRVLSWLCPECKIAVKISESKRIDSIESKVEHLDKTMREHIKLVAQSLKEQEAAVDNQTRLLERSVRDLNSEKVSYAEIVKGSCKEVVDKVSAKISVVPHVPSNPSDSTSMTGMVKVFDNFLDKDRRKNNLVVHNLPESKGTSQTERSQGDIRMFQEMIKESFRMSVSVARSFRVGKATETRARLLIVTLETPGVKQDVLRMAPQLRQSEKWGNIYITPDLTPAEREAAKKLREELAARKRAGEENLTIRRGKIVNVRTDSSASRSLQSRTLTGEGQTEGAQHGGEAHAIAAGETGQQSAGRA